MSAIARLNVFLGFAVTTALAVTFFTWPETGETASALASPYCANHAAEAALMAKAAYAFDLSTGEKIFAKNADAQLPLASLTKLMTVYTASGILAPNDTVTVTRAALSPEGSGLSAGEEWKASDLTDYTMIASVNDGAHALALASAEKAGDTYEGFIARMNANAEALGLTQTYFANDTGLDVSLSVAGAYGSARDMASLIGAIVKEKPRLLEATVRGADTFTALSGETHRAVNTSDAIETIPGAVASKTGFTDLAGGNLAIVFEPMPGHLVALSILGSTRENRDADIIRLADAAKKWMRTTLLCSGAE